MLVVVGAGWPQAHFQRRPHPPLTAHTSPTQRLHAHAHRPCWRCPSPSRAPPSALVLSAVASLLTAPAPAIVAEDTARRCRSSGQTSRGAEPPEHHGLGCGDQQPCGSQSQTAAIAPQRTLPAPRVPATTAGVTVLVLGSERATVRRGGYCTGPRIRTGHLAATPHLPLRAQPHDRYRAGADPRTP